MAKLVKIKGSDTVSAHAETVEIQEPADKKLIIRGGDLVEVDEYGQERKKIIGCKAGFDVVTFTGDLPYDIDSGGYELKAGKLKKKAKK